MHLTGMHSILIESLAFGMLFPPIDISTSLSSTIISLLWSHFESHFNSFLTCKFQFKYPCSKCLYTPSILLTLNPLNRLSVNCCHALSLLLSCPQFTAVMPSVTPSCPQLCSKLLRACSKLLRAWQQFTAVMPSVMVLYFSLHLLLSLFVQ